MCSSKIKVSEASVSAELGAGLRYASTQWHRFEPVWTIDFAIILTHVRSPLPVTCWLLGGPLSHRDMRRRLLLL